MSEETSHAKVVRRHLDNHPADENYVRLLLRNEEHHPDDPAYGSWLKFNLNGIERGMNFIGELEHAVGPVSGLRVLEVGAGAGGYAIALARHGCAVSAVEIDPVRLAWLRTRIADHGLTIPIHDQPVEQLRLSKGSVDLVTCSDVLEHVDDWRGMLRNLIALEPKYIYFTFPNKTSIFKILRDPHYGLFGVVFLEGRLRWLQRPYLRLRGIRREAWVVAIPLRITVMRFLKRAAAPYRVVALASSSDDKIGRPKSISNRPARLVVKTCAALGMSQARIQRLVAWQRSTHKFLLIRT